MKTVLNTCLLLLTGMTTQSTQAHAFEHDVSSIAKEIDQLISRRLLAEKLPASPRSNDSEFVRRVFLCLTGRTPIHDDTQAFLNDSATDKRTKLINRLLESPGYGEHVSNGWQRLFTGREFSMSRPPDTRLLAEWLTNAFNQNIPWDVLANDIIMAEGSHGSQPATIFFALHGNSRGIPEPNVITTTAGKLFLGLDLECAECHDHPFRNWSQQEFWSMAAFFSRVKDSGNKGGEKRWIKETPLEPGKPVTLAIPEASFMNVGMQVAPRLPDTTGTEFNDRESLRSVYAEWMTSAENPWFAQNIANRIWAHCFGRGLLNPLNGFQRSGAQPPARKRDKASLPIPTHPKLLKFLANELIASGFDQKHLLRCICLSETWQRTSRPLVENQNETTLYSHWMPTVLSPEMLLDSLTNAYGGEVLSNERPKMDFRNPLLPLYSPREEFIRLFRTLPKDAERTKYTYGIPQLLFLMNSPVLNGESPVVSRLLESSADNGGAIDHLYLAVLSRQPHQDELSDAVGFVERHQNRRDGLQGVLWTLFNRSEFMINH